MQPKTPAMVRLARIFDDECVHDGRFPYIRDTAATQEPAESDDEIEP